MTNIEAALKQRQDKFIEARTIIFTEVQKFLESLQHIPEEEKAHMIMPSGSTPQEILPELWNDPFDVTVYEAQLAEFVKCVASVRDRCDYLNERALECLK